MSTIDFDVNLISKINYRPSFHKNDFIWREEKTEPKYKRFLLFFKVKSGVEIKPAGFYEERTHYYYGDGKYYQHISEEYLIKYGYLIKEFGNHGGVSYRKEVWNKAYVEVSLGYKSAIGRSFNTDEEAKAWIEKLKTWSNKPFETIEYGS
jgi:hypothetical protein